MRYLFIFLFWVSAAYAEETILLCKFKEGDTWEDPDRKVIKFYANEVKDEYLKIDFDKEKIISAPHYENFFQTSSVFDLPKVHWWGSKKGIYSFSALLNRETGELSIIWNQYKSEYTKRGAWEKVYTCSKSNLKF